MPDVLVLSTRWRLVPRLVMVTVAPDTTALVESDTVPVISAVGVCAETARASASKTETFFTMLPPSPKRQRGDLCQSEGHYIGTGRSGQAIFDSAHHSRHAISLSHYMESSSEDSKYRIY